MPNFSPIIADAYREILTREPDGSGLSFYNDRMNAGISEADLRETLLRSPEYENKHPGFRPLVIQGRFNFDYYGYTSFGLFGRSLDERMAWVERGLNEGIKVFRVFSDTSFWPPDPLLDRVPKHRAVDASGLHPSARHIRTVRETIERVFAPSGAIMEYVILVTQFESRGPLYRRFPETEQYVLEIVDAFQDLSNLLLELGNEVEAHGKGWGAPRVERMLRRVRNRWPYVMMSCSSGRAPEESGYGNYVYPTASWANIHYPRRDFPELSFGWPTFSGPSVPVVDDEPEFYPRTTIEAYVRHFDLVQEQNGFMTVHSETGFVTDPSDSSDIPLLRALLRARPRPRLPGLPGVSS